MFLDILKDVAAHTGLDIVNQRAYLTALINNGAKDLYSILDTVDCLREQLFIIDTTVQECSLPYYVGELRAVRNFNSGSKITLHDQRPRYAFAGWREQYGNGCMVWRKVGISPLKNRGNNNGIITVTLKGAETTEVQVTITGGNTKSSRISETLIFPIGITTKNTSNSFSPELVESISKNIVTTFDISITNLDGIVLAEIPNSEPNSRYTIIQISDYPTVYNGSDQYVECLYKENFKPFKSDFDQFTAGDRYDKAIYWKTIEHWGARKEGKEELIMAAHNKCAEVLKNIAADADAGLELEVDFGPNQYFNLLPVSGSRRFR